MTALALLALTAHAATLRVPADHSTVQEAVAAAAAGDRVLIAAGEYRESVVVDAPIALVGEPGAVLKGASGGAATLTIDAAGAVVMDLVVDGAGGSHRGVVVSTAGVVSLVRVDVVDHVLALGSGSGAGASVDAGELRVIGGTWARNRTSPAGTPASDGDLGGQVYVAPGASLRAWGAVFEEGAAYAGGGVFVDTSGVAVVDASTFLGHVADDFGGAIAANGASTVTLRGSSFISNAAIVGADASLGTDAVLTWDGSSAAASLAEYGGSIASVGGVLTVRGGEFEDVHAGSSGGAIYCNEGDLSVTGATFDHATAELYGGCVYALYTPNAEVRGSSFTGCSATSGGAVALVVPDFVTVDGNRFVDSLAHGLDPSGSACASDGLAGCGGAVLVELALPVTISRNVVCRAQAHEGAGIWTRFNTVVDLLHNVVVDGVATGRGGGIYLSDEFLPLVASNTLVRNEADERGAGIFLDASESDVQDNLFLDHPGAALDARASGNLTTIRYNGFYGNLDDVSAALSLGASNLFVDPTLVSYSNADPCEALDLHPAAGSPLIDAGAPGRSDPDGSTPVDVGAYTGPTGADADGDGVDFMSDCEDGNAAIFPGAVELCNGLDDDCDGYVDDLDPDLDGVAWYLDADGDGAGDATRPALACSAPLGHVASADDCDDRDASVWPGAPELCDGVDNDCDALVDAADPDVQGDGLTWVDGDGDGYGSVDAPTCDGDGALDASDCDDADPSVYPNAPEICNDLDDDCDGLVDGADPDLVADPWWPDDDGDGYGASRGAVVLSCDGGPGLAPVPGDCADANPAFNPGADELCDGVDNDCDGLVDDADPAVVGRPVAFFDQDGDGFGDSLLAVESCTLEDGLVAVGGDCDDADPRVYPGAPEVDGVDANCNGLIDRVDKEASACGCSGAPSAPAAGLAWLALLGLARRRRQEPSGVDQSAIVHPQD